MIDICNFVQGRSFSLQDKFCELTRFFSDTETIVKEPGLWSHNDLELQFHAPPSLLMAYVTLGNCHLASIS